VRQIGYDVTSVVPHPVLTLFYGPIMARKAASDKEKRPPSKAAATKKTATAKKSADAKKAPAKKAAATKTPAKKAPAKRKSRSRSAKVVRLKAYWGVFNQSLKRVALFEHNEKKLADKKAKELTAAGKSPHFVQPVKQAVKE